MVTAVALVTAMAWVPSLAWELGHAAGTAKRKNMLHTKILVFMSASVVGQQYFRKTTG